MGFPNVPLVFKKGFPKGYRPWVDGWAFCKEKLDERLPDGTRKLLTLDVSISPDSFVKSINESLKKKGVVRADEFYSTICPHNCPGCFERAEVKSKILSWEEVKNYLNQAIELGLESVKFLGPGELLANPKLFDILEYLRKNRVKIGIFTKGAIIGNDNLAKKFHGVSSEELADKLASFDNVRLLFDGRSFDDSKANKLVPTAGLNFAEARNRAIELMANRGLNKDPKCQRMSLQTNPVTWDNIDEIPDIFEWGIKRNIPVIVTPTMVSGKGNILLEEARQPRFQKKLIRLYADLNLFLVKNGIMTLKQLQEEGIASYAATAPCNQRSCGMFIRKDGVVQSCPGNDRKQFIIAKDIRKQPLKELWVNSSNYKMGPVFNNRCVKDGYSIPNNLYSEVLKKIEKECLFEYA